jgi:hypothetical protein
MVIAGSMFRIDRGNRIIHNKDFQIMKNSYANKGKQQKVNRMYRMLARSYTGFYNLA